MVKGTKAVTLELNVLNTQHSGGHAVNPTKLLPTDGSLHKKYSGASSEVTAQMFSSIQLELELVGNRQGLFLWIWIKC